MIETKGIILSAVGSLSTLAVTEKASGMFQGDGELTLALWIAGGLLFLIFTLLCVLCKLAKDMRDDNRSTHIDLYKKMDAPETGLEPRLSHLEGSCDAAFRARGCAYDPQRLQKMVSDAVYIALNLPSMDSVKESE